MIKRLINYLEGLEFWWTLRKAWVVLKHRSFFKCPYCNGDGGRVEGYYEPEWCECHCCYDHYDELVDHGMEWFQGRLPLLVWLKAKIMRRWWGEEVVPLSWLILCKIIGRHRWADDNDEYFKDSCLRCYKSNTKAKQEDSK